MLTRRTAFPPRHARNFPARSSLLAVVAFTLLGADLDAQGPKPGSPPTLEACYVPISGTVYRIDTPASPAFGAPKNCLSPTHERFVWNQLGATGPEGPVGPKGEKGDPGANGSTGTIPRTSWNALDFGGLDGFAAIGTYQQGNPLGVSGAGTRAFWYPRKAAFRSGFVSGDRFDDVNIGAGSVAMGVDVSSPGNSSTAFGEGTTSSAPTSFAAGHLTVASGSSSTALGKGTKASGVASIASGDGSSASGGRATALGDRSRASGEASFATGRESSASAFAATAFGYLSEAGGAFSVAGGVSSKAYNESDIALGFYASASGVRSMALGIRAAATSYGAIAIGNDAVSSNTNSIALGDNARATNQQSVALGYQASSSGEYAQALGAITTASGNYSTALGHRASTNGKTGAFVYGDGSTVNIVNSTQDNQFLVRASGGVALFTNSALTAGALLPAGGGSWLNLSDARKKTAFRELAGEDVLAKLRAMPVRSWQYKSQASSIRHIGPTAQDFHAAFGVGESDTTIAGVDGDGVALAAAKALEARSSVTTATLDRVQHALRAVRAENSALRVENARVQSRLASAERDMRELRSQMAALAALIANTTSTTSAR